MREVIGDIWSRSAAWVVIPTNLGWTRNHHNVMGAGVARQAATIYPTLPEIYGIDCMRFKHEPRVLSYGLHDIPELQSRRLVMFPTKPLNPVAPHLSWRAPSSLALIEQSADQLAQLAEGSDVEVVLPIVGCGLGGLLEADVLPVLRKYLVQDRFILVRQPK